jgi:hypothetical protein
MDQYSFKIARKLRSSVVADSYQQSFGETDTVAQVNPFFYKFRIPVFGESSWKKSFAVLRRPWFYYPLVKVSNIDDLLYPCRKQYAVNEAVANDG